MNILSKPMDILSEQEVKYIHKYSLKLLEKVGMLIRDEDILKLLPKAHCDVNFSTQVARIKPGVVEDALKKVPHHVKLCGRNQKNDITLDGKSFYARPVGGPPNIVDLETRRRRRATKQDIALCAILTDALDNMHGAAMFNAVPLIS
jgi:trimethylamine--corrinoid protein Co-methyltransferase